MTEAIKEAVFKKPWKDGVCAVCDKPVVHFDDGGDGLTTDSLFQMEMRQGVPIGHRRNVVHEGCMREHKLNWMCM